MQFKLQEISMKDRVLEITIVRQKSNGEAYNPCKEKWKETDYFCPCCGKKGMMRPNDDDGGDYYQGSRYLCTFCRATAHLDSTHVFTDDEIDAQRASLLLAKQVELLDHKEPK